MPNVYLLAAGRGKRAGGPKAWLEHEGTSLLERHLALHPEAFVAVQKAWLARCRALASSARFIAVDPDAPAFASLHALLKAAPPAGPGFVLHVDQPVWEPAVFQRLAASIGASDAAVPTFGGKRGHPVLLSEKALETAAKLDPRLDRLDEFLRTREVVEVAVPFASVTKNWNLGLPPQINSFRKGSQT